MDVIIINKNDFSRRDIIELQGDLFKSGLRLRKPDSILGYATVIQYMKNKSIDPIILLDKRGKPYCKESPIKFNVSHSKDVVVCAFSEFEVGIDVEYIDFQNKNISDLYPLVLSNREFLKMNLIPNQEDRIYYFYKLWCYKESYVKKTGVGLRKKFNDIDIKKVIQEGTFFSEIQLNNNYNCLVCAEAVEPIRVSEIRNLTQWKLEMGLICYNKSS